MCGAGGVDHPRDVQLDLLGSEVLDRAAPAAEQHRRDVELHLVQEPGAQALLDDARATETSLSRAAAFARSSAGSMPSVTKVNVVPPSFDSSSRAWCVATKTGVVRAGDEAVQRHRDVREDAAPGHRAYPSIGISSGLRVSARREPFP